MSNKILIILIVFGSGVEALAQQFPIYNQHFVNTNLYNPANFGENDYTQVYGLFRQQWTSIQNAPQTQVLTIDGPVNERVGLGLIFVNDTENILSKTTLMGAFSYLVPITEDHQISFGISLGMLQNRIDFNKVNSPQQQFDNTLLGGKESKTTAEASAGISYTFKKLKAGFSAYDLLASRLDYENNDGSESIQFKLVRQYIASAAYEFDVNSKISITPKVLFRATQGLKSQLEANTLFTYEKDIWLGITYRETNNWAASLGTFIYDKITIGYSYEMNLGNFGNYSGASHEFLIGYRFGKKSKNQPTNLGNQLVDQRNYAAEFKQQEEKIDQLNQQVDQLKNEAQKEGLTIRYEQQEIEELQRIIAEQRFETQKLINRSAVNLDTEDFENSTASYYVVVGSFNELKHAKNNQKLLVREHALQTYIVQNNDQSHFLVYTILSKQKKDLIQELADIRTLKSGIIHGVPWIYKHD